MSRAALIRADVVLVVALGSALGSGLRQLLSLLALTWMGPALPLGTLAANVLGSFLMGWYATVSQAGGCMAASPLRRQFVLTGFCGGFTTFSIFSFEMWLWLSTGRLAAAALYLGISLPLWLLAAWAGHAFGGHCNASQPA